MEHLVTGSVGRISGCYVVSLRLLQARKARVENLVSETYCGDEDQLIRALKRAGRRLVGVEDAGASGTLAVSGSQPGASVALDGVSRGVLPLAPIKDIVTGPHTVVISKGGYHDWRGDAYVDPSQTSVIWVQLIPLPLRWYQRWWVWTLLAVTAGAGAVLGTVSVVLAMGVVFYLVRISSAPDPGARITTKVD